MREIILYCAVAFVIVVVLFNICSLFICTGRNIYVDESGKYYELKGTDLYNDSWKWQPKRKLPLLNVFVDKLDLPFWLDDYGFISYSEYKKKNRGVAQ